MPKISVIIPVYNDEKYIARCLDSFAKQTLQDIEIIVVNDGSTDKTSEILNSYIKRDSRIKVITQENQKQGAARNHGLKIANSDYIMYADSDDWVDLNYCEQLYNAAVKYGVDITVSSAVRIKENGRFNAYYDFKEEKIYADFNDIIRILKVSNYWQVWGKLYKKELLKDILFEEGVFYEDPEFLIKILHKCKNIVTVTDTKYYYFSNQYSTIKSKHNIAKTRDSINAMEKVYKYVKTNSLNFPAVQIAKEKHFLSYVKIFSDRKEYYFCGLKYYTKKQEYDFSKTIVVFNTACLGDVLLCNPLCQNLKAIYPSAKIVFVVDKSCYEVAKYQAAVDDVVIYDKNGKHKGLLGLWKFLKDFKYKNILASFITYKNERNALIAKLLKSKYIIKSSSHNNELSMQQQHCNLLKTFTNKKIVNYPMCYQIKDFDYESLKNKLGVPDKYIVICPVSKNPPKDMPIETVIECINSINKESKYQVILVGKGAKSEQYANILDSSCIQYVNTVGKTTVLELAALIQYSCGLISVDTGTMHLGCALKTPTVAVFYEKATPIVWAPNPNLYNSILVSDNQTSSHILTSLEKLTEDKIL